MDEADWERRLALVWASVDGQGEEDFRAAIVEIVAERPEDDGIGQFERASSLDSTGYPDVAIEHYRRALELGLTGLRRRRATIQLASSLRAVGIEEKRPELFDESVALLTAELDAPSDELDDAVRAFLALALTSVGRDREAASIALTTLAPHLARYNRAVKAYARELVG
jgi:tetratricopeptide (TPR) repeat protein